MSPKPWRWAGRIRPTDLLLELSAEQATGALYLNGRWGGTVFLVRGRIGYVESLLTPGVEALLLRPTYPDEQDWAELVPALRRGDNEATVARATRLLRTRTVAPVQAEVLRRQACADAALAALGTAVPETTRNRVRFRPGERHWQEQAGSLPTKTVLSEVNRRKTVLLRLTLGVRPEQAVQRVPVLPVERLRLTAGQWNILRLADGTNTPTDIAWLLGRTGFATTLAVHQLARLGVLTVTGRGPRPEAEPVPARHVPIFLPVPALAADPADQPDEREEPR